MRIENSFIPVRGVGEKTEQKLWRNGVTHWDEFDPSHVGSATGDRIESFIATASEHLDDGNSAFFASAFPSSESWRLYDNFRSNTCFFDIETTGLSHFSSVTTTVSLHRDGETKTLVRGDDLTAEALQRELGESDLVVSFNGKRFDQPFLEHEFDLSLDTPHVDLMYTCKRLGLTGGLSAVESSLGISRGGMDIGGEDAVRLWHQYEAGDEEALETLIEYNQYDTQNLESILEHACDELHHDVFAQHVE
ncbi:MULTISPECIES: ribonuclease H-like domain-containing protein [unclassified Haladaptatus]|uniref:ribonuclease H-like domain-containing protein n=1 Tax=unclassified Haladaptatus TaxID=2622732 RepID=UPI00209C4E1C|nr:MULTISPECIES: ribonuclease H-like domain-containing protein [unclassified Haladaptatus]MCO8246275.1 ribonuclease H-like domain-containing protein [Haladaptatus sp. AB643]MCO8255177.1 ribonuclease H-like domain-containing protein [Haladaptatus sp. AB618]